MSRTSEPPGRTRPEPPASKPELTATRRSDRRVLSWLDRPWMRALVGLVALVLLSAPGWAGDYPVRLLSSIFVYATMAQGWNLISGYTGYPAFGQAVFFGLGAYATGLAMTSLGLPFVAALVLSAALGAGYAALWGIPVLRLRGHYFAIATLAISEATRDVIANSDWAGGPSGIGLPIYSNYAFFYYALLALMVAATLLVWWVSRSRFGYGLLAIRENEDAAAVMGVNTTAYKVTAFALSGLITAAAGSIYAYWISFIDPFSLFDSSVTIRMIIMATLGGPGTVFGPVIGAFVLEGVTDYLWENFLYLHNAFLGVAIILIVLFLPRGVMDFLTGRRRLSWRVFRDNLHRYRV